MEERKLYVSKHTTDTST